MPVGEFFEYVVDDAGKRWIVFFQTTTKPLNSHPFSISSLRKWFEALGLFEDRNRDVGVRILCMVDWTKTTTGVKFKREVNKDANSADSSADSKKAVVDKECADDGGDNHAGCSSGISGVGGAAAVEEGTAVSAADSKGELLDVVQLAQHFPEIGMRLEAYVIRVGLYPNGDTPKLILGAASAGVQRKDSTSNKKPAPKSKKVSKYSWLSLWCYLLRNMVESSFYNCINICEITRLLRMLVSKSQQKRERTNERM
jgi:hypothetical protein